MNNIITQKEAINPKETKLVDHEKGGYFLLGGRLHLHLQGPTINSQISVLDLEDGQRMSLSPHLQVTHVDATIYIQEIEAE